MSRTTFGVTLDPDEEYRATALGRVQRLLDEERRRGKALADAVRAYLAPGGAARATLPDALAAWEGR